MLQSGIRLLHALVRKRRVQTLLANSTTWRRLCEVHAARVHLRVGAFQTEWVLGLVPDG